MSRPYMFLSPVLIISRYVIDYRPLGWENSRLLVSGFKKKESNRYPWYKSSQWFDQIKHQDGETLGRILKPATSNFCKYSNSIQKYFISPKGKFIIIDY